MTLRATLPLASVLFGGCASRTVVVASTPATSPLPGAVASLPSTTRGWSIQVQEHVDLWLHGLALLQADSSLVPAYRLDYRREATTARHALRAASRLDDRREMLARQLAASPTLTSAAFVALYFASWDDMKRACERFLRDQGDVRLAASREAVRMYATLATYFPGAAEREFLRVFVDALEDERQRFHRSWWQQEQVARSSRRQELQALWNGQYAVAFERFLRANGQRRGTLFLTLSLGPEGRLLEVGGGDTFIAIPAPSPQSDPRDPLLVAAHEAVGSIATQVVRDHTTPAQQQSGEGARLATLAAVRAGAVLLDRIAPELTDGYRRYYLSAARQRPATDLTAQFNRIFPLPAALQDALIRQVDLVLSGI